METCTGQDVLLGPRVYTDHHHGDVQSRRIAKAKGIYRSSSCRHMVKMYCQGQGYIQIIIMETCMRQDVLLGPRVYTDHHHGDIWSRHIAKAKGIYGSSSWRHVRVKTYCQGQGYIQIIITNSCTGEVVLLRERVYTCSKFYAHYIYIILLLLCVISCSPGWYQFLISYCPLMMTGIN